MIRRLLMLSTAFLVLMATYFVAPVLPGAGAVAPLSSQPYRPSYPLPVYPLITAARSTSVIAVSDNPGGGLLGHPTEPTTLVDLPGMTPVDFGHHYTDAISPDGGMLALITWPGSYSVNGSLHLINLMSWTDSPARLVIDDYVGELSFSPDGSQLYWTIPTRHDAEHGVPLGYRLIRYDIPSGQKTVIVQFPDSFTPWSQQLVSGQVAIVGVPTDHDNLSEGPPHLLIVDPSKGSITADVALSGVKAGQFQEPVPGATSLDGQPAWNYAQYRPGLAWDTGRHLLYIAHADDDRVSVIDVAKGAILAQKPVEPRRSWLQQLASWWTPTAEAKGGPEFNRRAWLSPDGQRLYVLGEAFEGGQPAPASLRMIATDSLLELHRLDGALSDVALSPDGQTLLAIQAEVARPDGFDMLVHRDLYVLDALTLQEKAHLRADQVNDLYLDGFSPDGRYAYLNGAWARWIEGTGWRDWQSTRLVLDQSNYNLTATAVTSGSFLSLVNTVP